LIAGTHRSGTSALARVVNLLGFTLPSTLLASNAANERGFWESVNVNRLNDELFAAAGVSWRAWQPLAAEWSTPELKAKALALLQSEFGDAEHFVLKDPRICRLLPFWRDVLAQFDARALVLLPLRHPLEVAASLAARNGIEPALSNLIWLRYVLDSEFASRDLPRAFVTYDDLLNKWAPVMDKVRRDLAITWPRAPVQAKPDIEAFLSPADRHHSESAASAEDPRVPKWVRTTYSILRRWARQRERKADRAKLNRIRGEFDAIPEAFLPFMAYAPFEQSRVSKQLVTTLRQDAKALRQQLESATETSGQLSTEIAQTKDRQRALEQQLHSALGASERERADAAAQLAALESAHRQALGAAAVQLAQSEERDKAGARRIGELEKQLEQSADELVRFSAHEQQLQLALDASERERSNAAARLAALENAHRQALAAAAGRLAQSEERENAGLRRIGELEKRLEQSTDELARLAAQLATRSAELAASQQQLEDVAARLNSSEENLVRIARDARAKNTKIAELQAEVERLGKESRDERGSRISLEVKLEDVQANLSRTRVDLSRSHEHVTRLRADAARTQAELSRRHKEREDARHEAQRLANELKAIHSSRAWKLIQRFNRTTGAALRRIGIRRNPEKQALRLLASSELFDPAWYLAVNPDVAAAGMDPALHYLRHGAAERRSPGPRFDAGWYLRTYTDVAEAGANPLLHYLQHGKREGREIAAHRPNRSSPPGASESTHSPAARGRTLPPAVEPLSFTMPETPPVSWLRHAELGGRDGALEVCNCPLGLGPLNGRSDASALTAFCRLMGVEVPTSALALAQTGHGVATTVAMVDIWYMNERDLRVRFDARPVEHARQPCVARFFQCESSGMVLLVEALLHDTSPHFVDVPLRNAFLPVLIALTDTEGELASLSLLPFPSLCRGGVHYAELRSNGDNHSYFENLQAVSSSVLAELLDSSEAPPLSVAYIQIDLQEATGAERIFSGELQEWLDRVIGIAVRPINGTAVPAPAARSYLEAGLRAASGARALAREHSGCVSLTLPADGVPSLHALVARSLGTGRSACAVGSFAIADRGTGLPRWSVRVPAMGEELLRLQATARPCVYPVLRALRTAPDSETGPSRSPLAVRFGSMAKGHPATLAMPVAGDWPGPLLRRASDAVERPVCIAIAPVYTTDEAFAALLETLKLQTRPARVIAATERPHRPGRSELLQRFFPGRHEILDLDDPIGAARSINAAAERATEEFLLVVGGQLTLHDPRTLEVLIALADHDHVASASCMLVQSSAVAKKAPALGVRSAGIFPAIATVDPAFTEPNCLAAFAAATYPVAANSSALFMVRTRIWRELGGFDTAFSDSDADIDYGVRAISRGFINLCTSVVSAELQGDSRPLYDRHTAPKVAGELWKRVTEASSVLEVLNA
jgi:hypothetical protein